MRHMPFVFTPFIVLLFSLYQPLSAQEDTQDTLLVPVEIYDFHSDGSNPDFNPGEQNQDYPAGLHLNLAADTLDENGLPVPGSQTMRSWGINRWFREWQPGDSSRPVYVDSTGAVSSIIQADHDTSYKNIKFLDTLVFIQDSGSIYSFERDYSSEEPFFPLDGKGFGAEPTVNWNSDTLNDHNYSFTMHIHREVEFEPMQTFSFRGDDDVWVFINNILVMDIGGIHGPVEDSFTLNDSLADALNLVHGEMFSFDFFYAERQASGSNIKITSNIITKPDRLVLSVEDTSIQAGSSIDISATLLNEKEEVIVTLLGDISWRIIPETIKQGDNLYDIKVENSASIASFTGTEAYHTVQIEANLEYKDRTLKDTAFIYIMPGPLALLRLEHEDSTAMPDDTTMYPPEAITIIAAGYDQYGNRRGMGESSDWTFSDGLHAVSNTDSVTQIYYETDIGSIILDENGIIRAEGVSNPSAYDEMRLTIKRDAKLDSAVTRDLNGDGYLDAVNLYFNQKVLLQNLDNIEIQYDYSSTDRINFDITSISPSDSGNVFTVHFNQDSSSSQGQTGWTLFVSVNGIEGITDAIDMETKDGAGPVIWSVVKEITSANDRSKDKITVTFSENVVNVDGNTLNSDYYTPEELFHVWEGSSTPVNCDSILNGIIKTSHSSDKIEFSWDSYTQSGDPVLTANHYFSIDSSANILMDKNSVLPAANNKRTKVLVLGKTGNLIIGPNPFFPSVELRDTLEDKNGNLQVFPVETAKEITGMGSNNIKGTIIQFELNIPSNIDLQKGDAVIKFQVLVFDAIGNLAYSSENNDNIIPTDGAKITNAWQKIFDDHKAGAEIQLATMWHGITNDGRKAAPGIYRVIIFLNVEYKEYTGEDSFTRKFVDNIGIRR